MGLWPNRRSPQVIEALETLAGEAWICQILASPATKRKLLLRGNPYRRNFQDSPQAFDLGGDVASAQGEMVGGAG